MFNGFGIVYGGISYSLVDSVLVFVFNLQGRYVLSIEIFILYIVFLKAGDIIMAMVIEEQCSCCIGFYWVEICKADG